MEEHFDFEEYKENLKCEFALKNVDANVINDILKSYGIHDGLDIRDVHIHTSMRRVQDKSENNCRVPEFTYTVNATFVDYRQWDDVL